MQVENRRAKVALLISDKIDFKLKTITIGKEGHYIIIKGSTHQEDITIINIYAPGTSLVVQCVRLHAPNVGGPGSIPGRGTRSHVHAATKSPHAATMSPHAATKKDPACLN